MLNTCYLDGNSLGRLPHATVKAISDFLSQEWGPKVVTGWEHWIDEAQTVGDLIGRSALGAGPGQVLACDTTSVNLYQLALAAIKARPNRKTIITDAANFPTDRYIMQGIAKSLGLNLITINNEDSAISENELITPELLKSYLSDDVALVSLQVVQYRSGARQDIKTLTDLVKSHGALMLWDAAHAVGSVVLDFDRNGVDLAVGCTYKYGNSGPGAPAWLYVSKGIQRELQVPIQGWFAQRDQFAMGAKFERVESIRGFQIASPSLMGLRCIKSAFAMIEEAGITAIEAKAASGTEVRLGAGVQHVGERLGETGTKFELPAYTLVRLFGAWRATDRVEVFGEVQNLFDETYYPNSFATLWVQPGAPRTGSVGVRLRF